MTYPTVNLQPGATGEEVKKLQDYLVSGGYMTQAEVDTGYGIYGPKTTAAISKLQQEKGVDTAGYSGYWGPKTIASLSQPITSSGGKSPEDLARTIDTGIDTGSTESTLSYGTSEAARIKERMSAIKEGLGLGEKPQPLSIFTEADKTRMSAYQNERDALLKRSEDILAERTRLTDEFNRIKRSAGIGTTEGGRIGTVTEEGRKIQDQLDTLNREELVLETKLNNRNNTISELMNLQRQSYEDAVSQYNTEFSNALQLYSIFDKEDDELKQNSKASLDVLFNAYKANIEAGQLDLTQLSPIQKARIEEYEVQAGLPLGSTLAMLSAIKPGEEKLYAGIDKETGDFTYITKDASGKLHQYSMPNVMSPETSGITSEITLGGESSALVNAFNSAVVGLSATQMKQAQQTFQQYINSGDIEEAKNYLIRVAMAGAGVDQQNQTIARKQASDSLSAIRDLLDEARSAGVSTNILTGSIENIAQKLGTTTNPKLASISTQLNQMIQVYRRGMTGVAFSPAESAEYKKIFPDITNVATLNATKIDSLLDVFDRNNKSVLSFYIGDKNYDTLFGKQQYNQVSDEQAENILNEVSGAEIRPTIANSISSFFNNLFGPLTK